MTDPRFKDRRCPGCGERDRSRVFDLPAERFCASNWTYSKNYAAILGIEPDTRFPIASCRSCGFLYAEQEPNIAFLSQVYDEVIRHDANRSANQSLSSYARRMRYVADLLELAPVLERHKALDYGCGLGTTLRLLDASGVRSVGFDTSEIRTRDLLNSDIRVVTVDELRKEAPFDVIVCDNVLEHLPNPLEVMQFLESLSLPGTVLYASVPNYDHRFVETQRRAADAGEPLDMSLNPWEHLNYFDLDQLDAILGRAGFFPVPDLNLPGPVEIGLRRDAGLLQRSKNVCATSLRLARYALTGQSLRTPNRAFYRYSG